MLRHTSVLEEAAYFHLRCETQMSLSRPHPILSASLRWGQQDEGIWEPWRFSWVTGERRESKHTRKMHRAWVGPD